MLYHALRQWPAQRSAPFLYEIIHPSGTSLLANTQVPVICSKHVILASVAPHPWRSRPFSRCDTGSALTRPLSTVSSQLEPSIWNRPIWASEEVCQIAQCIWCAAWHRTRVSCSDEPSVLGVFWRESGPGTLRSGFLGMIIHCDQGKLDRTIRRFCWFQPMDYLVYVSVSNINFNSHLYLLTTRYHFYLLKKISFLMVLWLGNVEH